MTPIYTLGQPIMSIENVGMEFVQADGSKVVVLDGVNAVIHDLIRPGQVCGQIVGFLGPSGSGKTTLFRIMAGTLKPTRGGVYLGPEKRPVQVGEVGVVPQNYPLFMHRTVLDNLVCVGMANGMGRKQATEKAWELLKRFGIDKVAGSWPKNISGGQKQRTAIARQLMRPITTLLMDEPVSGLDPLAKETVCQLIVEVGNLTELSTIVVVTHDTSSAVKVSDTLWLMGKSRDAQGNRIGGAHIVKTINLIDQGLAWQPNIEDQYSFGSTVREINRAFREL